jgi:alanine racemase
MNMDHKLRSAWVEIEPENIRFNLRSIKQLTGEAEIIGIIKADAYGHGAVQTAGVLMEEGVERLAVATLEEAVALRGAGIDKKIIILGMTPRDCEEELIRHRLIATVSSYAEAARISRVATGSDQVVEIIIAVDTGMGREGFMPTSENIDIIMKILELPGLSIVNLLSHFAAAGDPDQRHALEQLQRFNSFCSKLFQRGFPVTNRTMAASAAVINLPQSHFEAVRPGILLYGAYPEELAIKVAVRDSTGIYGEYPKETARLTLKPALSVRANIVQLRSVPAGSTISYGAAFTTERTSLIGVLPLGYADGIPRYMSGKGQVIVRGCLAPIVGTVCMDMCMIDVTKVPGVAEYDEAIILGSDGKNSISASLFGERSGTISYEVFCRFGQRLPRVYKSGL